jgi:hypothetical protein
MKVRVLYDPNAPGGAFALPPENTGGQVGVISTDGGEPAAQPQAPAAPAPQAQPQQQVVEAPGDSNNYYERVSTIRSENDPVDPWTQIEQQPAPPPEQQAQPPAQEPPPITQDSSALSPDGKYINIFKPHPQTGERSFYTKIPNTPEAIATYAENQAVWYENQIAQMRQQVQPPPQQQAPQPPPKPQLDPALRQAVRQAADEAYGGEPTDELAAFGERLLEIAANIAQDTTTQTVQKQTWQQQQIAEYQHIRQSDPDFDLQNNQLAREIMRTYPHYNVREVHMAYEYHMNQARKQMGQQPPPAPQQPTQPQYQPNPQPTTNYNPMQSPPQQQPIQHQVPPQPDPRQFQRPIGSQPAGLQTAQGDTPYVTEAINFHIRAMGGKATAQSIALIRQDAMNIERTQFNG